MINEVVLGPIGIITGTEATGYPFLKEEFEKNGGIYSEAPVVVGDRLITSKGHGTTLEFTLAIVRKAKGEETKRALREGMVISRCDVTTIVLADAIVKAPKAACGGRNFWQNEGDGAFALHRPHR